MTSTNLTPSQESILNALTDLYNETDGAVKGEDIAKQVDRNPGTIRNQIQSLKALQLVEAVSSPNSGYKPTSDAYETLDIDQTEDSKSISNLTPSQESILTGLINLYKETDGAVKGEDIAKQVDRNPGTIRNQIQSLKALQLVEAVSSPNSGYKPTPDAYETLDIDQTEDSASMSQQDDTGGGSKTPESIQTISLDKLSEDNQHEGAIVEIEGEHGVVESIVGGRVRVNLNPDDDLSENKTETQSTEFAAQSQIPKDMPSNPTISIKYDELNSEQLIGSGGNAEVTKSSLSTSDGVVTLAIKEPQLTGTLSSDQVEQMLDEAELWDKLDEHDHIVGVVDYGNQPVPWIAMEYMDGGTLVERCGDMDILQALWTTIAVTNGVRHAHKCGIAHLDLKPQNLLFRSIEGAWDVPKVADWGLSKHLVDHSKSINGYTPAYSAPEQLDEEYGRVNHITDIYQLGAVFYELFTGSPPFDGDNTGKVIRQVLAEDPTPPSKIADVPPALDEILLKALAKDKSNRYEDIVYLRDDLQELFDRLS